MTTTPTTTPETLAFRSELALALGWLDAPVTLRELAVLVGATVDRVRYHVGAMVSGGAVETSRDRHGRILVSLPTAPAVAPSCGVLRRLRDDAMVRDATAAIVARAARAARRELGATPPAWCPVEWRGLGVICWGGERCYVEPLSARDDDPRPQRRVHERLHLRRRQVPPVEWAVVRDEVPELLVRRDLGHVDVVVDARAA